MPGYCQSSLRDGGLLSGMTTESVMGLVETQEAFSAGLVSPTLRNVREGQGTHFCGCAAISKAWATRQPGQSGTVRTT